MTIKKIKKKDFLSVSVTWSKKGFFSFEMVGGGRGAGWKSTHEKLKSEVAMT